MGAVKRVRGAGGDADAKPHAGFALPVCEYQDAGFALLEWVGRKVVPNLWRFVEGSDASVLRESSFESLGFRNSHVARNRSPRRGS